MNKFPKLQTPGQKRIGTNIPDSYEVNPFRAKEENKIFKTVSPFMLFITFQYKPKMVKKLKDGSLLIKETSKHQSEEIICPLHEILNFVKGKISCWDLNYVEEQEILENLKPIEVTDVKRNNRPINGIIFPTSTYILTIRDHRLSHAKLPFATLMNFMVPHQKF